MNSLFWGDYVKLVDATTFSGYEISFLGLTVSISLNNVFPVAVWMRAIWLLKQAIKPTGHYYNNSHSHPLATLLQLTLHTTYL